MPIANKWQREYISFQKRRRNVFFPNHFCSLNKLDKLRKFCWCTPASIQSFLSNTIQPQCINAADAVFLGEYLTRSTPGSRRYTPWALVREEKRNDGLVQVFCGVLKVQFVWWNLLVLKNGTSIDSCQTRALYMAVLALYFFVLV